jgi:diguanylate cyclase (GGDEF)-like protein
VDLRGFKTPTLASCPTYLLQLAALAGFLFTLTLAATWAQADYQVGPIWPLTGLGLAAMWQGGLRWWPAVFVSQATLSFWFGVGLPLALSAGCIETLAALLMFAGVKRFRITPDFGNVRNVLRYLTGAVTVSLLPSFLFLAVMAAFDRPLLEGPFGAWGFYWVGEVLSFIIFTPAALVLTQAFRSGQMDWPKLVKGLAPLILAGLALSLADSSLRDPLFYALLPLAVFAAAFAGIPGAMAASIVMVMVLLMFSRLGVDGLLELWVMAAFVGTTTVTGQLLAAMARERLRVEEKLAFQAHHDALTGLANRFHFEQRLRDFLSYTHSGRHACLYLDLNRFKLFNDTCGHGAGDRLLEILAGDLAALMPEDAVLARVGGDEFGVLLPEAGREGTQAMVDRLQALFEHFEIDAGGSTFRVGAAIGITEFGDQPDTPDTVLGRADVACNMAKNRREGGVHFYRPDDEDMVRRHGAIRTISELHRALQSGRLSVHAQRIERAKDDGHQQRRDGDRDDEVVLHDLCGEVREPHYRREPRGENHCRDERDQDPSECGHRVGHPLQAHEEVVRGDEYLDRRRDRVQGARARDDGPDAADDEYQNAAQLKRHRAVPLTVAGPP